MKILWNGLRDKIKIYITNKYKELDLTLELLNATNAIQNYETIYTE